MKRASYFSCFCWFLAAPALMQAAAEVEYYSAAGISFPTLAVPVGVRATGMGNAYTAAGDDV